MDFSKIMLVLKREYLTRVRTKSFILSTLLTPLVFVLMMGIVVFVSISDGEVTKTVGVIDHTGVLFEQLQDQNPARYYDVSDLTIDSVRSNILAGDLDGYIILSEQNVDNSEEPTWYMEALAALAL